MRGKESDLFGDSDSDEDHPRLCGEKTTIWTKLITGTGSPPPMRGKDIKIFKSIALFRITPAYAGKSNPVYTKK